MKLPPLSLVSYSASLKLTLFLFLLFGAGSILWHFTEHELKNWLITVPMLLLALNLMTALLTNKIFRFQGWLLLFHIGLLLILLLIGISQVTKLIGNVEVTNGSVYDSSIAQWQQGVLHPNRLDDLQFRLDGFSINYAPAFGLPQRLDTQAKLIWLDESGVLKSGIVGDNIPLEIHGYKFYTTFNKGFAPMFKWIPHNGEPVQGSVHLPSWPANEFNQSSDLQIPGTPYKLWLNLKFVDTIIANDRPSEFRIPNEYTLVVRAGENRQELLPGESMVLDSGRLQFLGLNTWMGFQIHYDWALPWLLAVSLLAVFGLGGHFWHKFAPTPWLDEDNK